MIVKCSICGCAFDTYDEDFDICQDCIARMDDCESCKLNFEEDEKNEED